MSEFIHKTVKAVSAYDIPLGDKGLTSTWVFGLKNLEGTHLGHFCLSPMPGCCGIVVVHGMYLEKAHRGSKYSDFIRELKEELCKGLGYTVMVATSVVTDIPAMRNMEKSGYRFDFDFVNKRTYNKVSLGSKFI